MAGTKISQSDLIGILFDVFRTHGMEGTTLKILEEKTGLKKASLYHRFPGGKDEMARVMLATVYQQLADTVLEPLVHDSSPQERMNNMCQAVTDFYQSGEKNCLLNALSIGNNELIVTEFLKPACEHWHSSLCKLFKDAGFSEEESENKALTALALIQGALILQRVTNDSATFETAISQVKRLLQV